MPVLLLRFALRVLPLTAMMLACGASFVIGYRVGYEDGWHQAVGQDALTFRAALEYVKNKPGR